MMSWILLVLVVGVLGWLLSPAKGSHPNPLPSPEALGGAFTLLLERGLAGATVTITIRDATERALLFTKYIKRDTVGFTSTLRVDSGSANAYSALRDDLSQRGIRYTEPVLEGIGTVMQIDYKSDFGLAQVATRLTFLHIFDASVEQDCVALFKKVITFDAPHLTGTQRKKG
jgi:hypothetical protein